jgi:hypothetical protein
MIRQRLERIAVRASAVAQQMVMVATPPIRGQGLAARIPRASVGDE